MSDTNGHLAFTKAVQREQEKRGSRAAYARMDEKGAWRQEVTDDLAAFIAERDSFYLATSNADGLPYIQHRGGAPGFLKVLDKSILAFADFAGNKQYITLGNLAENDRAFIFLMDYANRRRIKLWGRAEVIENAPDLIAKLVDADYLAANKAEPERAIIFHLDQWDANCPQHITPRYTNDRMSPVVEELNNKIETLEVLILDLQTKLAHARANAGTAGEPGADRGPQQEDS
ncbi:MAG: pyridoxamine 5'-phosphate oxidase [Alphaproteobacteria bacterium]|nr:pyridoxamine 5'-phosphate oxidase [Alphaproteobacteria bacterium]